MFLDRDDNYVQVELHTTRYLGRAGVARGFLDLVADGNGLLVPDRWGTDEKARESFRGRQSVEEIVDEWTASRDFTYLCFRRRKPFEIQMSLSIERYLHAKVNSFSMYVRDPFCRERSRLDELVAFVDDVARVVRPEFGFIAHTLQERRQSPELTLAERLPGIYWANYFGPAYIDFFGRETLKSLPDCQVSELGTDLLCAFTSSTPYDPALIDSDETVDAVKVYLNHGAFPGPDFPDEPCVVPRFDFSDVRNVPLSSVVSTAERTPDSVRRNLEEMGYAFVGQTGTVLRFRDDEGFAIAIDLTKGDISVDATGGK